MGYLVYGGGTRYAFDDRTLAHLKIAVTAKLRLRESFLLSWTVPAAQGSGRVSLWLSPAVPLQFLYTESTPPALNQVWLKALALSSHGTRGLIVISEDDAEATAPTMPASARKLRDDVTHRHPNSSPNEGQTN